MYIDYIYIYKHIYMCICMCIFFVLHIYIYKHIFLRGQQTTNNGASLRCVQRTAHSEGEGKQSRERKKKEEGKFNHASRWVCTYEAYQQKEGAYEERTLMGLNIRSLETGWRSFRR